MSQQGPILIVSTSGRPELSAALDDAKLFPVIDTNWADATRAVEQLHPAAVLVAMDQPTEPGLHPLAKRIAAQQPYLPLIAVGSGIALPDNAIPFTQNEPNFDRLMARLRASLRVRALHIAVMRRLGGGRALPDFDPTGDATVLLIGRGTGYPALSVALGERMGVVGALSIEAAAKHLNVREIHGIVIGAGFGPRVVDAFLTVLTEDARFRHLPVVLTTDELAPAYDLPNLEIVVGEPAHIGANALPLIRQRSFEAHLTRTLKSIEADGLLDVRTGLLTLEAFNRDFATSVYQTLSRGGGLSVARFVFDPAHPRAHIDGARILSRLMRPMDFGAVQPDGSVIVAFADTDLRNAHMIARRLSSVMRHTSHGKRELRSEPIVTVAAMQPNDSAKSLLARLYGEAQRAAS